MHVILLFSLCTSATCFSWFNKHNDGNEATHILELKAIKHCVWMSPRASHCLCKFATPGVNLMQAQQKLITCKALKMSHERGLFKSCKQMSCHWEWDCRTSTRETTH